MNTKSNKAFASAALVAAVSLAGTANAAGHHPAYRASCSHPSPAYEFRVVSRPAGRGPLVVQLVNSETGQPVSDARVNILRPLYLGIKAAPMIQNVLVPLKPDGQGDYVYSGARLEQGERLILRGHVPGESSAAWETIVVVG